MSQSPEAPPSSPLATALPWDLVADGYVAEALPYFQAYARDALARMPVEAGTRVLDVAAGPGTLTVLAAERGARVQAIDFSREMTARLRARVASAGLADLVVATEGDGQKLPFASNSFDVAFSLFGLMFFPDRHAGLSELVRVLVPGGAALISSWVPFAGPFAIVMESIREFLPGLPFGGGAPALASPEVIEQEMAAAGFREITVDTVVHELVAPSFEGFWALLLRTNAPLVLLRHHLGEERWNDVEPPLRERVAKSLGEGPVVVGRGAYFGRGKTAR